MLVFTFLAAVIASDITALKAAVFVISDDNFDIADVLIASKSAVVVKSKGEAALFILINQQLHQTIC